MDDARIYAEPLFVGELERGFIGLDSVRYISMLHQEETTTVNIVQCVSKLPQSRISTELRTERRPTMANEHHLILVYCLLQMFPILSDFRGVVELFKTLAI